MVREVSKILRTSKNESVLLFLKGKSAHSDAAEVLRGSLSELEKVQLFCPDPDDFHYVVAYVENKIFGFEFGMRTINFRLPD